MPISEIPLFSMLRTRMHWHQERQRLLAENVANADTAQFQPRDLAPPAVRPPRRRRLGRAGADQRRAISPAPPAPAAGSRLDRRGGFEVRPAGNAVNLEDEMIKVASNQMDYQAATALYTRGLGLIKTAHRQALVMIANRTWGAMDFLKSIAIAASGLRAQAGRMRVISENIANADSTAPAPGSDPYRRKIPTFR